MSTHADTNDGIDYELPPTAANDEASYGDPLDALVAHLGGLAGVNVGGDTMSSINYGDEANRGAPYVLDQIDPNTLPEDPADARDETTRRYRAYKRDQDGWRTGTIASEIDDYAGVGES